MVPKQPGGVYCDLTSAKTLPGQNTQPPSERVFSAHFIVKPIGISGPVYVDPPYGVTYSNSSDFEGKAVFGYFDAAHPTGATPAGNPIHRTPSQSGGAGHNYYPLRSGMTRQPALVWSLMMCFFVTGLTFPSQPVHVSVVPGSVNSATVKVKKGVDEVPVMSRELEVKIKLSNGQTATRYLSMLYDPVTGLFWWNTCD